MSSWIDFYNSQDSLIYVSPRHRDVHYRVIADGIAAHIPSPQAQVLDYGSGQALHADRVAASCAKLVLVDAAPNVRAHLQERFAGNPKIAVMSPEEIAALPEQCFDLIVMHSVSQYLDAATFDRLLASFKFLLKRDGRLVIGDVVPPKLAPVKAALSLLRFAAANGFFVDAVIGLVRIALSDYKPGNLTHYTEAEMLKRLENAGLFAQRSEPNIGHNQSRMAFAARITV